MSDFLTFRSRRTCKCMAEWLVNYEAELLAVGEIKSSIDIYQLQGGAPKSGGTHTQGGAADIAQHSVRAARIGRQMGAAFFIRPYNWDNDGGGAHAHLVLNGCPHNGPARYQVAALNAGYNGLGRGGQGGRDTGPRTSIRWPLRTWEQGIAWQDARERTRRVNKKTKLRKQLRLAAVAATGGDRITLRKQLRLAAVAARSYKRFNVATKLWAMRWTYTRNNTAFKKMKPRKVASTLWDLRKRYTG